jgi:regulator of cell morphogenesis and NO signaling
MTTKFNEMSIVGEIVTEFPKASDFFKKNKIDFCCGGNRPLGEVVRERKLQDAQIVEQLNELYENNYANDDAIDWRKKDSNEIIDHIINKHHAFLREELSMLLPYVKKVMLVHGDAHPFMKRVHELFIELTAELLEHTNKEEEISFPAILSFESKQGMNAERLKNIIIELEAEHDRSGNIIKEIRELTSDFTLPEGACRTFELVYNRLEFLEEDTFQHIHLENNILFPRYM